MKIISIANQKGGVAKTTTAVNIGAGLALRGNRVLLIDIDSQSHLSRWLGHEAPDGNPTVSELIYQEVSQLQTYGIDKFIRHNEKMKVDFIPSNHMLSGIISIIGADTDVLKRIFASSFFSDRYDYIIIDCLTSLDLLVTNALKASDKLLIPVQADMLAYEGVNKMLLRLQEIKNSYSFSEYLLGLLVTMYQKNTNMSNSIFDALKTSYGSFVFNTPIAYRTEVKESSVSRTALVLRKGSYVGQQYRDIVDEVIERC